MMKFFSQRVPRAGVVELYIQREDARGFFQVKELVFTAVAEDEYTPATAALKPQEAQELIDALWDAGLRPSEGSGSAGAMLATQHHLADMRKLVAKQLDVALKDC